MKNLIYRLDLAEKAEKEAGRIMLEVFQNLGAFENNTLENNKELCLRTGLNAAVLNTILQWLSDLNILSTSDRENFRIKEIAEKDENRFSFRNYAKVKEALGVYLKTGTKQELASVFESEFQDVIFSADLAAAYHKLISVYLSKKSHLYKLRILDLSDSGPQTGRSMIFKDTAVEYYVPPRRFNVLKGQDNHLITFYAFEKLPQENEKFDIVIADCLPAKFKSADNASKVIKSSLKTEGILIYGESSGKPSKGSMVLTDELSEITERAELLSEYPDSGLILRAISSPGFTGYNYNYFLGQIAVNEVESDKSQVTKQPEKTSHETLVIKTLSALLQIPEKQIDLFAELEELGLDSMLINELASKLSKELNIKINPSLFITVNNGNDLVMELRKLADGDISLPVERTEAIATGQSESIEELSSLVLSELSLLLQIPVSEIDRKADLGDLGLDSMLINELAGKLSRLFCIKINPALFISIISADDLINTLSDLTEGDNVQKSNGTAAVISYVNGDGSGRKPESLSKTGGKSKTETCSGDVAIVGVFMNFPGASEINELWSALKKGDNLRDLDDRLKYLTGTESNVKVGLLSDSELGFDYSFFNLTSEDAENIDPKQALLLQATYSLIENAGYNVRSLRGSDTSVFIGVENNEYVLSAKNTSRSYSHYNATCMTANRISYMFNFKGTSEVTDTACASSVTALKNACADLLACESDMAIAGGISLIYRSEPVAEGIRQGAISRSGVCRSFDEAGDGWVMGEGLGLVLLKRYEDAVEDKDYIYGVIKGIGITSCGKTNIPGVPDPAAIAKAAEKALKKADLKAEDVQYLELHGLGIPLLDSAEIGGLQRVFGGKGKLKIGSITSSIGNLEPACGMAGLMKLLACFRHAEFPAQENFSKVSSYIELNNFEVSTGNESWKNVVKYAGLNVYGYSGVNGFVILQSHQTIRAKSAIHKLPLFLKLSAKSDGQLKELAGKYSEALNKLSSDELYDFAATVNVSREDFQYRAVLSFTDNYELASLLADVARYGRTGQICGNEIRGIEGEKLREWVNGGKCNWNELFPGTAYSKLPAPSYPFRKEIVNVFGIAENNCMVTK